MTARLMLFGIAGFLIGLSSMLMLDRALFLFQLWRQPTPNEPLLLDLRVMSAMSALMLNVIPLSLGIGLYQRANWARTLTIVLALSMMIPSVLAELKILRDPTPMQPYNWLVVGICTIVALVLINPHIGALFRKPST
ncbi:MAG: hypothetical protein ACK4QL_00330 [Pseudanabaenaceae cyanobacterium]